VRTKQRIKREMREKKKGLKRADRKERSILSELDKIDRDIQTGRADLADQQRRLREAETAFREIEQNNTALNHELVALKQHYSQRLRVLYKMSRNGYAAAVFSADGPDQTLKRIKYLGMIAGQDQAIIREYSSALMRLAARQRELAEKKNELLVRQRAVETKKGELESRRRKKAVILAGVRQEKGLYEQSLRIESVLSRLPARQRNWGPRQDPASVAHRWPCADKVWHAASPSVRHHDIPSGD
jgi:peptidoglycan hydrolase CwlO-like protein